MERYGAVTVRDRMAAWHSSVSGWGAFLLAVLVFVQAANVAGSSVTFSSFTIAPADRVAAKTGVKVTFSFNATNGIAKNDDNMLPTNSAYLPFLRY